MPEPGHVERDRGEFWVNAQSVIRACIDGAGINAREIRAIGCAAGGVLSFFSPLSGFMIVVIAIVVATFVSGIYAIQSLATGQERFTRHLTSGDRVLIWFCSIFGIAVAGFMGLAALGLWGFLLA